MSSTCKLGLGIIVSFVLVSPFAAADEFDDLVKVVIEGATTDAQRAEKINSAAGDIDDNKEYQKKFYLLAFDYGLKKPDGLPHAKKSLEALEAREQHLEARIQQPARGVFRDLGRSAVRSRRRKRDQICVDPITEVDLLAGIFDARQHDLVVVQVSDVQVHLPTT